MQRGKNAFVAAPLDKYWDSRQFSLYPETFKQRQLCEQPKGHPGLNAKAEEKGDYFYILFRGCFRTQNAPSVAAVT